MALQIWSAPTGLSTTNFGAHSVLPDVGRDGRDRPRPDRRRYLTIRSIAAVRQTIPHPGREQGLRCGIRSPNRISLRPAQRIVIATVGTSLRRVRFFYRPWPRTLRFYNASTVSIAN